MINLFRAEWVKIAGNRWVTSCLLWIFPLAAVGLVTILAIILALSSSARTGFIEEPATWTEVAVGAWDFVNNPAGRLVILAFTAVVFAGEYQWGTWKNTIPRSQRTALILVKFATLGVLVVVAFVLMSVLATIGVGIDTLIAGGTYGPEVTGEVVSDFLGDYALQASTAFTGTLIAAGYAALAAMITKSILGGIVVSFVITFAENLLIVPLALLAWLLDMPRILYVYRVTPGYNLLNVTSWVRQDMPTGFEVDVGDVSRTVTDSLEFSIAVLALWVFGLVFVTVALFRRQDITT